MVIASSHRSATHCAQYSAWWNARLSGMFDTMGRISASLATNAAAKDSGGFWRLPRNSGTGPQRLSFLTTRIALRGPVLAQAMFAGAVAS